MAEKRNQRCRVWICWSFIVIIMYFLLSLSLADVNEIQHFVNVALATAAGGEGDLQHDKLSVLRTVGNGFAYLIYKFPSSAGFVELQEACTYLWDALSKNRNLPTLLVSVY